MEPSLDAPEAVEVMDLGDRLRITRRWFYWTSVPLGLGALVWLGLTLCKFADDLRCLVHRAGRPYTSRVRSARATGQSHVPALLGPGIR